jgi:hypothetical protein
MASGGGGWWRPEEATGPVTSRAVSLRPRLCGGGSRGGSVGRFQGGGGPRRPGGGGRGSQGAGVEVGAVEAGAVDEPGHQRGGVRGVAGPRRQRAQSWRSRG